MSVNDFKWKCVKYEGATVYCEGENDKFFAGLEYIGVDLHGNQMWSGSLFHKESSKPIPVNDYGTPFTSLESAKEAVMRAINKEDSK